MAASFRVSVFLRMPLNRTARDDHVIAAAVFPSGSLQLHLGHNLTSGPQGAFMV